MELEYLDSGDGGIRTVAPWQRNLEKLGIRLNFRAVDFALYQQRLQKFDFDITIAYQGTNNRARNLRTCSAAQRRTRRIRAISRGEEPGGGCLHQGHDQRQDAGTAAARLPCAGARHCARSLPDSAVVGRHHRMAYNAWRLAVPSVVPPYSSGEGWVMDTWWARSPAGKPAP
jgi:microcin C transport system substrate-binding protein